MFIFSVAFFHIGLSSITILIAYSERAGLGLPCCRLHLPLLDSLHYGGPLR